MSSRKSVALVLALATAGLSAAHAASTGTWVGGEIGFIDQPVQSTKTREAVRDEFLAFRRNPVSADGTSVWVGGERGYVNLPVRSTTTRKAIGSGTLAVRR